MRDNDVEYASRRYVYNNKKLRKQLMFIIFVIFLLILTVLTWLGIGLVDYQEASAGNQSGLTKVVVEEGDTLWAISRRFNSNEDMRKIVYRVKKINNLTNANIYPGQQLIIPVK